MEIDPRGIATSRELQVDVISDGGMISLCSLSVLVDATAIGASLSPTTTTGTRRTHAACAAAAASLAWGWGQGTPALRADWAGSLGHMGQTYMDHFRQREAAAGYRGENSGFYRGQHG